MKTMISILLALLPLLIGPAWASNPSRPPLSPGPETTLDAAALYLDGIFHHTLTSLELIAFTPEAQNGDWQGIKKYLSPLASNLPGVYFFVLPDGNYYNLELDYTNLNLYDRPYFESLFAGNQVKGFPISGRWSGKKSALMATPIVVNGKVTGALGASIFLDDLSIELNRKLALANDHTWFVLNSEGNTLLDRDRDYLFMNALTQGSDSLREAVSTALQNEAGTMLYELDGIPRHAHYRKLAHMDWWMVLAKLEGDEVTIPPSLKISLDLLIPELQHQLGRIDASLNKWVGGHPLDVGNEEEIRKLLTSILRENSKVVNATFIDREGVMRYIEPTRYRKFENTDTRSQEHVAAMLKNPAPTLSNGFTAVEGSFAVSIAHPAYDDKKAFAGSISLLVSTDLLMDSLVDLLMEHLMTSAGISPNHEFWVMQPDGMILYDLNRKEIGRMLFSDPLYAKHESLLELGKKIASSPSGKGRYIFFDTTFNKKTIKHAAWGTVGLHDREWRVIVTYRSDGKR